ncbi:hypothetical protein J3R30DRAFT_8053 [Lentinula aciculospora]|uniref:Uncharacterized protein n=1 Tax=Lentinula aciculospora TaxID=153920 RepID=A0A9W9ATG1_9AGAR|nr:hypothetical protein J3R30DRAFT_8053 [Lentinula aciculospora]
MFISFLTTRLAHVEPTAKDLGPLLNSQLLSKSLIIFATERPPSDLPLLLKKSTPQGPTLLILRLQPLPHAIPQYIHSILSRAEVLAQRWRQDRTSIFSGPGDERGRSKFRRNTKNISGTPMKAVQLAEIGGVFGREFTVREEVGFNPNTASASALPTPTSSSTPRSRAPSFISTQVSKKVHEQRAFDALIHFVPYTGIDEESQGLALKKSIASVSSTSRAFLSSPAPIPRSSRGRSMSKGSRGRSSSLNRVRNWIRSRSRSRSKTRNDENSVIQPTSTANEKYKSSESDPVGRGRQRRVSKGSETKRSGDANPTVVAQAGPSDFKGVDNSTGNLAGDSAKRTERGVLTSWSRTQLGQANRAAGTHVNSNSSLGKAEPKAYLIHVLPLSPPTSSPALLQTSFSRGHLSTLRSQGSSSSVLSSADTEMPPLGASRNAPEELKDNGISRVVPPAQKPESIKSSIAVALNPNHDRSGSFDSEVRWSSIRSSPVLQTTPVGTTQKATYTTENPALIISESSSRISATPQKLYDNDLDDATLSHGGSSSTLQQSKDAVNRRASLISPALEAAVESATQYSLYASKSALPPPTSRTDIQLQRQNTAIQVASAAAIAALEVRLTKANEVFSETPGIEKMPMVDLQLALDEDESGGTPVDGMNSELGRHAEENIVAHSRESMGIPEVLMPHPYRQSSLVFRDSIFQPLDVDVLFQICTPEIVEPPAERSTPVSLLPRPHARARTQSLDSPTPSPSKSDVSSCVPVIVSPRTATLSLPTLSPTDADYYYEKNDLLQEMEQFLLSYSYASLSSPVNSILALPKGAAKPVTIGGAGPVETKGPISNSSTSANPSNPPVQDAHAPASFLLPQGLLQLLFRINPSSFLDDQRMSMVDLILHGLLDPTTESLAVYRDAMFLANKLNPSVDEKRSVTLNELLALGALSGEEAGVAHGMPKAWIGGIADIEIENAIPECFHFASDSGSTTIEGLPAEAVVTGSHSPEPPITTSIFSKSPMLSAVSLHSQTVARSLREQGGSQLDLETVPTKASLTRIATSPELSSLQHLGSLRLTHNFIPPGAALPISPHLPNVYSAFPRHSVMIMTPPNLANPPCPQHNSSASIESGPQSVVDSITNDESSLEADNQIMELSDTDTVHDGISEHSSCTSLSSDPNLNGAIPLPSLSSPLLGSPHSSISGTVATSHIFSDEPEILVSQLEPKVTIHAVSVSDSTSAIIDSPQPTVGLLLGYEPSVSISGDTSISSTSPESPSTPTEPHRVELPEDSTPVSRYGVHGNSSTSPAGTTSSIDGRRDSKLWIQRSPKSSGQATPPPESPHRGYFSGITPVEERRNSRASLLGESILNIPGDNVDDSPNSKGKLLSLSHMRIRRHSTITKKRPSSMYDDDGNGDGDDKFKNKTKRLSRAISWMVTDTDSGPSYKLDMDDVDIEEGQRFGGSSKTNSPVKSFFANLAASASSTSLLNLSDKGRRLSTSSSSIKSGIISSAGSGSTSIPNTHSSSPSSAPIVIVTPTSSPLLSILSLPLHNLSNRPETPPGRALIISESTPSSTCSTIAASSVSASLQQRLLASSGTNLARRHTNGAAPVGPRAPKRGGSLRMTCAISLNDTESTQSQLLTSPSSSRPLPSPASVPLIQSGESVSTDLGPGIVEEEADNHITPFPTPLPMNSSKQDCESGSEFNSRPQSRGGTPTAFSPLRKLAIDEVPSRTKIPRASVLVGKTSRPNSIASTSNVGTPTGSSKSKWKFWGIGGRPVSVTVDLTREI